jgi:hypothetical protein
MLKARLAAPECISFTAWGFTDAESWIPAFFTGEPGAGEPLPRRLIVHTAAAAISGAAESALVIPCYTKVGLRWIGRR